MKLNYVEQSAAEPSREDSDSKPAAILMHGMFGSFSNLGNLARELSAEYRVIAVDLRNHGDSPHEDLMTIPLMAGDIIELMDDLGLPEAHLIGHSLGGKVAMQIAQTWPDRVRSLVVADIAPVNYPQSNSHVVDALNELHNSSIQNRKSADQILAGYIPDMATRGFILKNLQPDDRGGFSLKLNVRSIVANYSNSLVEAPEGPPFNGPCLFLKGELSAYIQDKHRPLISSLFPASELLVIEGAGHWLHAEKPKQFNSSVISFLNANR
ncbi:alpha/beta fold hydrolase [Porticoccaceae bacterium]|nr:alpha/beta fold hydrolase [Porticoccaceae bacterium]